MWRSLPKVLVSHQGAREPCATGIIWPLLTCLSIASDIQYLTVTVYLFLRDKGIKQRHLSHHSMDISGAISSTIPQRHFLSLTLAIDSFHQYIPGNLHTGAYLSTSLYNPLHDCWMDVPSTLVNAD